MKKRCIFLFFILLLVDICTKMLTCMNIPVKDWYHSNYPYGGIPLFSNIYGISCSLVHVENQGAAWGLFSSFPQQLMLLRCGIIAFLILYFFFSKVNKKMLFALTLVLTGAVGNVIDFFLYNHVIDMVQVAFKGYIFPVFNFADSCISIGIFLLLLFSHSDKKVARQKDGNSVPF